jgi:MFS family permease
MTEFGALTSFLLLISVLPMLAVAGGASSAAAGLITGALLAGTLLAEVAAAFAIRRFGYRAVLAAGALLLGGPTLALLAREPAAVIVTVSFVRGLGFGLCGVTAGSLTAQLLPAERRGEGLGLLGIVSGVPAIIALPAGAWLAGHHQATLAVAVATAAGLLPLAGLRWLPGGRPGPRTSTAAGPRSRATFRLPLVFAACTVAAGVIDSFLPVAKGVPNSVSSAALLATAVTATISRWQAGRHGDRYGHARLLIPAIAAAALGPVLMAALGSPAAVLAGALLFGAGFGAVENSTFALLIERLPEDKASTLWNLAYDAGYGAGPLMFGLFSARAGYPLAFALTGVLVLTALPAALRERTASAAPAAGSGQGGAEQRPLSSFRRVHELTATGFRAAPAGKPRSRRAGVAYPCGLEQAAPALPALRRRLPRWLPAR